MKKKSRSTSSSTLKKKSPARLHPNNRHHGRYDFSELCVKTPELKRFLKPNPSGDQTIDFADAQAVLCLNKALLAKYYGVQFWDLPEGSLCPPIPGRADYIHYLAELIEKPDTDHKTRILDIGTGANLIYPIIGSQSYGWTFLASDIDATSISSAKLIAESNSNLKKKVRVIQQLNNKHFFKGVIAENDYFEATMCNPPFHSSAQEAQAGSDRKWRNLNGNQPQKAQLNFGGKQNELWCDGGERAFVKGMIQESLEFQNQVSWFTSLISKEENLTPLKQLLTKIGAKKVSVINMSQGQKISRILAWSFK